MRLIEGSALATVWASVTSLVTIQLSRGHFRPQGATISSHSQVHLMTPASSLGSLIAVFHLPAEVSCNDTPRVESC